MWIKAADVPDARWRKSTRSSGGGAQCVELAVAGLHLVRDSKNPTGPVLALPQWTGFLAAVKSGVFAPSFVDGGQRSSSLGSGLASKELCTTKVTAPDR